MWKKLNISIHTNPIGISYLCKWEVLSVFFVWADKRPFHSMGAIPASLSEWKLKHGGWLINNCWFVVANTPHILKLRGPCGFIRARKQQHINAFHSFTKSNWEVLTIWDCCVENYICIFFSRKLNGASSKWFLNFRSAFYWADSKECRKENSRLINFCIFFTRCSGWWRCKRC